MHRTAAQKRGSSRQCAILVGLTALLAAGCSSAPATLGISSPSYLGAGNRGPAVTAAAPAQPRVTSSKVLSAIVFERVTGLEVDPARLVQP